MAWSPHRYDYHVLWQFGCSLLPGCFLCCLSVLTPIAITWFHPSLSTVFTDSHAWMTRRASSQSQTSFELRVTKVYSNGTVERTISLGFTNKPINIYPSLVEIEGNLYLFYQNNEGIGATTALDQDLNDQGERPIGSGRKMTHPTVAYDHVFQTFGMVYFNALQGQSFFQKLKLWRNPSFYTIKASTSITLYY